MWILVFFRNAITLWFHSQLHSFNPYILFMSLNARPALSCKDLSFVENTSWDSRTRYPRSSSSNMLLQYPSALLKIWGVLIWLGIFLMICVELSERKFCWNLYFGFGSIFEQQALLCIWQMTFWISISLEYIFGANCCSPIWYFVVLLRIL